MTRNQTKNHENTIGEPGMTVMQSDEIKEYLPHRYPFLLVDRVLECVPGGSITAIKCVSVNEPFFQGHFPHYAVMPGVLIIEALAQTAALLALKTGNEKRDDKTVVYLAGIDHARFKRPVVPGDTLTMHAKILVEKRGVLKFAVDAYVGDTLACEAELLCTKRTIK
jgi:3-hydroxyacyl-[acyl-carrier-protein] dehydratase